MAKALTLMIPDDIYEPILRKANRIGQSPEQVISEWIRNTVRQISEDDPLLQLAGIFESDIKDISEHHDDYIGQNL